MSLTNYVRIARNWQNYMIYHLSCTNMHLTQQIWSTQDPPYRCRNFSLPLHQICSELAGGSQREERLEVLEARMRTAGMDPAQYGWYLDLRRFGSAPHSGFGLGFERLVLFCTGSANIRECIPFPRTPGSAPC